MSEIDSSAREQYLEARRNRRAGIASQLGEGATFVAVKPDFYADARTLSEDALRYFHGMSESHPPYGLVSRTGEILTDLSLTERPWHQLAGALRKTGHVVFEEADPTVDTCPYHAVLATKLDGTRPRLKPVDYDINGLDTLRNVVTPGGELNASLFISLIRRLPDIQKLHGSTSDPELFARASSHLLVEPLGHPQQWAVAFVLSLGSYTELVSDGFLNDELATKYTKIERTRSGQERLGWAIPTEDFVIRSEVEVTNRALGSELDNTSTHKVKYPVGTRIGDIEVNEPTIGCPGNQLAAAMWDRVIDVVVAEDLWTR